MKFQSKIILASSFLLVAVVTLVGVIQYKSTSNAFKYNVESSVHELIRSISFTITHELNAKRELVNSVTHTLNIIDVSNKDIALKTISTASLKESFQAVGIGYEENGQLLSNDGWIPDASYDVRNRPWYRAAAQAQGLVVTKPYIDSSTHQMIISVSSSLLNSHDQFIGNVVFDLSLKPLADLVNQTDLFGSGYLFMMTNDGTVIAHPDSQYNGQPVSDFAPGVQIQTGVKEILIDGVKHLISLEKVQGEDWYVGAIINEDRVFSDLYKLNANLAAITLVALIIVIMILYWVIRYLFRPINDLNAAIKNVASGEADLTHRLQTNTDTEFAELAKNFNQFISNLQEHMSESKRVSEAVKKHAEMTQLTTHDTGVNMSHQMAELGSLATAMEQMTAAAHETAKSTQNAANNASEAEKRAIEGADIVKQTEARIETLSSNISQVSTQSNNLVSATNSIGSIIDVINEVANQTNLLALNATIESARAGQAGRGFAVVADHVRLLSLKTQESTTQIHAQIDQLRAGTTSMAQAISVSEESAKDAVLYARKATETLNSVQLNITQISEFNGQIAAATEEQSSVSVEVNRNTQLISQLSQKVTAQADTTNINMDAQLNEIHKQQQILDRFKL